jgi:hypothetical protein
LILRQVIKHKEEHLGDSPTYRDIASELDISLATVFNARQVFIELGIARETDKNDGGFELEDGKWEWEGEWPDESLQRG